MNRLELRIPPPAIMLVAGGIMWLLSASFPGLAVSWDFSLIVAVALALLGVVVSLAGMAIFRRSGTTADPRQPAQASALVVSGIYGYSRNPMYLGILLILVGWAVFLGNPLSVLLLVAFVCYITRYQIVPEERLLQEKFADEFSAYKTKVRRWL
ncbi:isoprenylcysteine carboxylmethyltransferase family protein [Castellaniella sp.]|uniref:methyltransferase family protein n=1 Tax=Castellaniella sp. TaxID=1955812 RepID=UPI002AFE04FC|nr:isoprenylcysteine carboxylmethyltransferase family protein [Castellaniella sp.]